MHSLVVSAVKTDHLRARKDNQGTVQVRCAQERMFLAARTAARRDLSRRRQ